MTYLFALAISLLFVLAESGVIFPNSLNVDIQTLEDDATDFCPKNNPKVNEKVALSLMKEVIAGKDASNLEKYVHKDLIQHNPQVADGIKGIQDALAPGGPLHGPPFDMTILRVSSRDDFVYIHDWVKLDHVDLIVFDIFRFECAKIVEHWDVLQTNDRKDTKSRHPFFFGYTAHFSKKN